MQQHIVATRIFIDAILKVAQNKQKVVWRGVAGSSDNTELEWRELHVNSVDYTKLMRLFLVGFWLFQFGLVVIHLLLLWL